MKALVIEPGPQWSVLDVQRGIVGGLSANGVQVASYNLGDRLTFYANVEMKQADGGYKKVLEYENAARMACDGIRTACWDMRPDVVIIVSSFFVPPETYINLRQRGVHLVLWCTESPYEDARQVPMAGYVDTVIVNDPSNIDEFRKINPNTFYVPHGYNPYVHHNRKRTERYPFSFTGTGYPSRIEFFEKVDWPCEPAFAGNWKTVEHDSPIAPFLVHDRGLCVDNTEVAGLYRSSLTSCNLYRKEAMAPEDVDGWSIGPREVELAMTGCWFAREPRPEGDGLFPSLPTFTEPSELADQIRWALAHPEQRQVAITQAAEAVADRTFQNNAATLLRHIDV